MLALLEKILKSTSHLKTLCKDHCDIQVAVGVPTSRLTATFQEFGARVVRADNPPDKHLSESRTIIVAGDNNLTEFSDAEYEASAPRTTPVPATAERARRRVSSMSSRTAPRQVESTTSGQTRKCDNAIIPRQ
jgi:hypothetical protein